MVGFWVGEGLTVSSSAWSLRILSIILSVSGVALGSSSEKSSSVWEMVFFTSAKTSDGFRADDFSNLFRISRNSYGGTSDSRVFIATSRDDPRYFDVVVDRCFSVDHTDDFR